MEARAFLKNDPHPPRKMRLLADMVRGLDVQKALFLLQWHSKKAYSTELSKLIKSAVANWQNKHGESADIESADLYIKELLVDGARVLKRIQPAPQGRAHRIRKRFSHISVTVASRNEDYLFDNTEVSNAVEEAANE
jgi:large subunit ribosomal protein L22